MKLSMSSKKFKTIDLGNGINVGIVDGRDGKVAEINISGQKKKLSIEDVDSLINVLTSVKQWIIDNKL